MKVSICVNSQDLRDFKIWLGYYGISKPDVDVGYKTSKVSFEILNVEDDEDYDISSAEINPTHPVMLALFSNRDAIISKERNNDVW